MHDHRESIESGRLRLTLHWSRGLLARAELAWATGAGPDRHLSEAGVALQHWLSGYASGNGAQLPELELHWDALSDFTGRVLRALSRGVPPGQTMTYGGVAALLDRPGAARAVGRALGANPWPLLVPCHRVVGAGGALTGYSNPCGLEMKAYLLELEAGGRP